MTFGERLRELRLERQINQRDLAERVGIDVTYLSKIENDRMDPPAHKTIEKLTDALDVNADELLVLAKKVPEDLKDVITESPAHPDFFRSLGGLSDKERERIKELANKLRQQRDRQ